MSYYEENRKLERLSAVDWMKWQFDLLNMNIKNGKCKIEYVERNIEWIHKEAKNKERKMIAFWHGKGRVDIVQYMRF